MAVPGTQAAKVEQATREISGDPKFRLLSTLPNGGVVLFVVTVALIGAAAAVIFIADGMLAKKERVDHALGCAFTVYSAVDVTTDRVTNAPALETAGTCFASVKPVDGALDPIIASLKGATAQVAAAAAGDDQAATAASVKAIRGHLAGVKQWAMTHGYVSALPEL